MCATVQFILKARRMWLLSPSSIMVQKLDPLGHAEDLVNSSTRLPGAY